MPAERSPRHEPPSGSDRKLAPTLAGRTNRGWPAASPVLDASLRSLLLDAVGVGAAALCLYLALGQQTLYGDAMTFLRMLRDGTTHYERHVFYLPALHLCHGVLSPLGATVYQTALFASQLGAALGVALLLLAARGYGLSRGAAWLVAMAFALCPGTVFFSTVVELHGPFTTPVGLAWLLGAVFLRRPGVVSAVALGISTVFATGMHSSGALLPVPVLGALLVQAWPASVAFPLPLSRRLPLLLLAGGVHAALVLALTGGVAQFAFVSQMAPVSIGMEAHALDLVWWEWVWPFLPISVLFLCGLRSPSWRRLCAVVALSLPVYLVPSYLVLAMWREYGAYLIPLAFPAAVIVVGALPRAWTLVAIAVAATVATAHVVRYDRSERPREYAAGARALAEGRPLYVLGGDEVDIEASFVSLTDATVVVLSMPPFIDAVLAAQALAALDAKLGLALTRGEAVLLSRGADVRLRDPRTTAAFPSAGAILPHLETHYRLEPVQARGFAGWRLRARD